MSLIRERYYVITTEKDMNELLKGKISQTYCSSWDLPSRTGRVQRLTSTSRGIERKEFGPGRPLPNILAVISDPKIRKSISKVIGETGVGVTAVSSLCEAREILGRERASLVICSARLSDGTFRELLPLAPKLFTGIVVLCSGNCSSGARIDALELGIMDYVSYPLLPEELQWVIRGAISMSLEGQAISAATV